MPCTTSSSVLVESFPMMNISGLPRSPAATMAMKIPRGRDGAPPRARPAGDCIPMREASGTNPSRATARKNSHATPTSAMKSGTCVSPIVAASIRGRSGEVGQSPEESTRLRDKRAQQ